MVGRLWQRSIRRLKELCGSNITSPKVSTTKSNKTETTRSEPVSKVSTKPAQSSCVGYSCINNETDTTLITLRPHQADAVAKLESCARGQIIVPTGGGKTIIGIMDALRRLEKAQQPINIIVVAPRIMLALQLCEEYMEVINDRVSNVIPAHIHSGDTSHFSTTKVEEIKCFDGMMKTSGLNAIYFTTYHSLPRLAEAGISVDTMICDEAHNSIQKAFFPAVQYFSQTAARSFFYTATPKHSATHKKVGMNDTSVYGNVIVNVPAPKLVKGGFIVPPQVVCRELPLVKKGETSSQRDCDHVVQSIFENNASKVLVCAKAVKQIVKMVDDSDFVEQLSERGYSYMYIAASTGAVIDGNKVSREDFFKTLNAWGKDNDKKFVVLHHSILSEGINVSGLEAVVFMRSMDYIGISQTIGRVIRLHKDDASGMRNGTIRPGDLNNYTKSFGLVIVPVFSKAQQGCARSIQNVVDIIFSKGEAAVSTIKR